MQINFSKLFHISSKSHVHGRHVPVSPNSDDWPIEWKTTYYKTYANVPTISLPVPEHKSAPILSLITNRKSSRDFNSENLTLQEISIVLKYACGETGPFMGGRFRRAQPSGGSRFPIEVYPLVLRSSPELSSGVYHYNVEKHTLDVLGPQPFNSKDIERLFTYKWVQNAPVALILTSIFWRSQMKYGERGYRYILLEAGHIGQNIYLLAESLSLKCCALGGTRDEVLESLLDIDGNTESIVYALALGK